jgi:hypothetical protein
MVKLTGKKYALSKRQNVTQAGVVTRAKPEDHLYFIKYEYNNQLREDWFFVDNITCRTVQEQEQRLMTSVKKPISNNSHTQNIAKKMKTGK